jgi:tetratricopeptide (TPR) repeat protein
MKAIFRSILLTLLVAALVAPACWSQQQQSQQPPKPPATGQQPAQPAAGQIPGAAPAAPPENKEEEDAYKLFFELPRGESQRVLDVGDEFLKKFPESRYRESVYARMAGAYLSLDQVDKMYVAGEKALELNPTNVDVLAMVAWGVPRRLNPGDLDAQQKLDKCEKYAKQALEIVNTMVKPEGIEEEAFNKAKNEKMSMAHSGLAVVYFHRERFADMASEMELATQLNPNDPTDFYLLGMAYQRTRRWSDAATAYGKCGEAPGQLQPTCKRASDLMKKQAAASPTPPAAAPPPAAKPPQR